MINGDNLAKIFSGFIEIARKSHDNAKEQVSNFLEKNIIKGKYITREEYEILKKTLDKKNKK